jgi:archaellum biogenesis ATPase FlaH
MSNIDDSSDAAQLEELKAGMAAAAEHEKIKEETAKMQAKLNYRRATVQLEHMERTDKDLAVAANANYGKMSEKMIQEVENENNEYMEAAKKMLCFIDFETFGSFIPFFRKNLILIGADTGDGKSTCVANIAYGILTQKNLETGSNDKRALVLTNEEEVSDVLNRLTCLGRGWSYTNHNEFSDVQVKAFKTGIRAWTRDGRVTVVNDTYGGSHGVTTTLEGMENVFERLMEDYRRTGEHYDAVLIDYYQNIITSVKNSQMSANEVQERLGHMLDRYKNIYPAPIILFAQMKKVNKDDRLTWKERIGGRKRIADFCTCVIEMTADKETHTTGWTVWKSRFTKAIGKKLITGFDGGLFVKDNDEFRAKVQKMRDAEEAKKFNQQIGIKPKDKDEKKD